jgi:hypothetical protein
MSYYWRTYMANRNTKRKELPPLKITCTSSDCVNDLHCFKKSREMAEEDRGRCRSCGADLIEWDRIHQRDLGDVEYIFSALKYELVRHHFWHKPIDKKAENHARRKGRNGLQIAVKHRLENHLAPINNPFDGRQTPLEGNVIFYAQHALGCCCRTCLEYWHGIKKREPLREDHIKYLTSLIMLYIEDRMPFLTENGEKIPPIRNR